MKNINKFVKNNIDKTEIDTNAAFDRFAKNNELVNDTNSLLKTISNLKRIMAVGFSLLAVIITTLTAGIFVNRYQYNNSHNEIKMISDSMRYANNYFGSLGEKGNNYNLKFTKIVNKTILYNIYYFGHEFYGQLYIDSHNKYVIDMELYADNVIVAEIELVEVSKIVPIGDITNKDCSAEVYYETTLIDSFSFKIS